MTRAEWSVRFALRPPIGHSLSSVFARAPVLGAWAMIASFACVAYSPNAASFFESGSTLAKRCSGDVVEFAECVGFLAGVADTLRTQKAQGKKISVCLPRGVTKKQLADAFLATFEQQTQRRDIAASTLVIDAFRSNWPCRRK